MELVKRPSGQYSFRHVRLAGFLTGPQNSKHVNLGIITVEGVSLNAGALDES